MRLVQFHEASGHRRVGANIDGKTQLRPQHHGAIGR
jgi:hypothetical protein